ncbi:MAG: 3-oxoacyl-[acyl-carrier protein] reductase [Actinomycetota bacterium]|jgi:NAD(P)-dependent dehydrogenase (short-subunit alcohol dehydrogenase family)|nr:3-oxoacyl-[acyl-carrier protein] reductase [Actinomycetota bacterium]
MAERLQGKSCIVTGAGRGIGRAIALAFGAEGARVVVNDVDPDAANEVVQELKSSAGEGVVNTDAVGSVDAAESILKTAIDSFGDVDVLVNNAGILRDRMIHNMTEEEFDVVIQVHLKGTWACGRAVIQHWRPTAKQEAEAGTARHRKIINVTSASGLTGSAGQSNYAAAKMGIVGLTKTWAKELGSLSINVNAIAPAALTAMTEPLVQDPEQAKRRYSRFALGRYGSPEEIAPGFVYFASDESNYVTGQVLCIDGGLVI